jgi:hypothetical protein
LVFILRHIGEDGLRLGYQNTDKICFFGITQYADNVGIARSMGGLSPLRDNAAMGFKPIDDPDRVLQLYISAFVPDACPT